MLGFTKIFSGIVQALRVTELKLSGKFRRLLCGRVFLGEFMSFFLHFIETASTDNLPVMSTSDGPHSKQYKDSCSSSNIRRVCYHR